MIRFWIEKIILISIFIRWKEWSLAREEWNVTYRQMQEARSRAEEINRSAAERLLQATQENS